jgi:hypothetical protein
MQANRTQVEQDWEKYQTMIDAIFVPYPDERSSSVVPLASALIELYVAEALKIETQFLFKSDITKDSGKAKALEYVWKYDWRKNNRKKVFVENEYIAAGFGTSIIYTGFEQYDIVQKDFEVDNNGDITRSEKTINKQEIIVRNVDIRNFYIDNQAIEGISDASDCIYRQWISFDKFNSLKTNPLYKNTDYVTPREYSSERQPFVTTEELVKQGEYVELMHYWNVEKDVYMVLANGVLVREHPMVSTID